MTPGYINPGDPLRFPAEFYNSLIDLVRNANGGDANYRRWSALPFGLARIKNSSGADRASLDVLRVSGSELTPTGNSAGFKQFVCVTGSAVSTTLTDPFVVLVEPVKSGVEGLAFCSGIFPARINIGNANHTHAGLKSSDSTQLDSSFAGPARILYKESGTGTKLAVVQYPVVPVGVTTSPTTIGAASEGSESADSTTWTRSSAGVPLEEWYCSRVGYWHAGDEKLYAFYRKRTYDSLGLLISVSAETRVEIDAPEDC